ncbi:hypothetical protein PENANT_c013G00308 [Penicillium antarcticum]|uniref:Uncharacterized protein n=1 Tax=Penicillium antarcticum TaxID=416450 RepID=A0A1V6Q549_9EURO|nr:hypothetical protein PENANT_c013G00308 [Penicillium antarcticum]
MITFFNVAFAWVLALAEWYVSVQGH